MHLRVGDLAKADGFYRETLGFDPTRARNGAAFLSSGRYHHHLGLNVWQSAGAGRRDEAATGLAWFSLEIEKADLFAAKQERLRQAGVAGRDRCRWPRGRRPLGHARAPRQGLSGRQEEMPMDAMLPYRTMAYNNGWANHRLLTACAALSQAEFTAPRTGFFPSLRATLNHILIIDRFYIDALEGGTLGPAAWANQEPCETVGLAPRRARRDGPAADRLRRAARRRRSRSHRQRPPRQSHSARADGPAAAASVPAPDPSSRPGACDAERDRCQPAAARRVLRRRRGAVARDASLQNSAGARRRSGAAELRPRRDWFAQHP